MQGNPMEDMCHAGLALIKEHATLFSLESKLAKQSLIPFIASLGCAFLISITAWATVLALIGYVLYVYTHHIGYSLAGVLVLQLLLGAWALIWAKQYHQRMQFKETRAHLKHYLG